MTLFLNKVLVVATLILNLDFIKQTLASTPAGQLNVFISKTEYDVLTEFKKRVLPLIPTNSLVYNFSQDDLYLLGWLRSSQFKVKEAEFRFLRNLRWRIENKIDEIEDEYWPEEFQQEYPAYVDTFDKNRKPTAELWAADWDIRKAILTGQGARLSRWVTRVFEMSLRRLFEMRRAGMNVTSAVILGDVGGFSFRQTCPLCNQIFIRMGEVWENYYPEIISSFVVVNVNPVFQRVLKLMSPLMSSTTQAVVKTYVMRKNWLPILDQNFDKIERSPRFGGSRIR